LELGILAIPKIEFWTFPFSSIAIVNFGVSKHWNCEFWLFQTMEFFIFGFSTHWNCKLLLIQTFEW